MTKTAAAGVTATRTNNLSYIINLAAVSVSLRQDVFDLLKKFFHVRPFRFVFHKQFIIETGFCSRRS